MARLALLYDVHGNLSALEAVLGDAREAGVARFLLGGDYALFGPCPAETVNALRRLPDATWIRGNVDRWAAAPESAPDDELIAAAIRSCRGALGADVAAQLGALDEQVGLEGVRYCHASPLSDMRSFLPEPAVEDDELQAGATERRIVFGHTHIQFRRIREDETELLNPGSVGMPLDGDPRAAYALIQESGDVELRRVAYDVEASAEALSERFGESPWAQRSIRRLRTAAL